MLWPRSTTHPTPFTLLMWRKGSGPTGTKHPACGSHNQGGRERGSGKSEGKSSGNICRQATDSCFRPSYLIMNYRNWPWTTQVRKYVPEWKLKNQALGRTEDGSRYFRKASMTFHPVVLHQDWDSLGKAQNYLEESRLPWVEASPQTLAKTGKACPPKKTRMLAPEKGRKISESKEETAWLFSL